MNLIYLLANTKEVCDTLVPIMTLLGYLIYAIKIVVPVILIIMGMIELAKAITEKKDDKIKEAQNLLIKKVIVAVIIYLIITIVSLIMNLIGAGTDWKTCAECAFQPNSEKCYIINE